LAAVLIADRTRSLHPAPPIAVAASCAHAPKMSADTERPVVSMIVIDDRAARGA
jgi:hypothetical protein